MQERHERSTSAQYIVRNQEYNNSIENQAQLPLGCEQNRRMNREPLSKGWFIKPREAQTG